MISIKLYQQVHASCQEVSNILLDHVHLNRFFNANFRIEKAEEPGEINGGKGTIRQVTMSGIKFNEEILSADNSGIRYQIIGDKPVKNHQGNILLSEKLIGAELITGIEYKIVCESPWFIPSSILKYFIQKDIKTALTKIAFHFDRKSS